MKIFIGADHNGFALKEQIEQYLKREGHKVTDVGNQQMEQADDFPLFAARVANEVLAHADSVGILICGSGQGVCIAANRFKGIRASLVWDEMEAKSARNDDDSNVLCLAARELNFDRAKPLIDTWLRTPFAGAARFTRRIKQLDELN